MNTLKAIEHNMSEIYRVHSYFIHLNSNDKITKKERSNISDFLKSIEGHKSFYTNIAKESGTYATVALSKGNMRDYAHYKSVSEKAVELVNLIGNAKVFCLNILYGESNG